MNEKLYVDTLLTLPSIRAVPFVGRGYQSYWN